MILMGYVHYKTLIDPPYYQTCALGRSLTKIDQRNNVPDAQNVFLPEYPFYESTKTE